MNTRKYPRTLDEAFPFDTDYACAITRPSTRGERLLDWTLGIIVAVCLAAALVNWWAS